MIDALFYLSKYSKIQKKSLEILHGTTDKVIANARQKLTGAKPDQNDADESISGYTFFLFCLLHFK